MLDVLFALEQLVIFRVNQQFALGIFLFLEYEMVSNRVNIEAVLTDKRHLCGERVVVDGLAAGDVGLQFGWFGSVDFGNAQGAEPKGSDDVRRMWNVLVGFFDGNADCLKIAPRLFKQCSVELIGD